MDFAAGVFVTCVAVLIGGLIWALTADAVEHSKCREVKQILAVAQYHEPWQLLVDQRVCVEPSR